MSDEIDGFAIGRSNSGMVILAFFDGQEYHSGVNMSPKKAGELSRELHRAADKLEEVDEE